MLQIVSVINYGDLVKSIVARIAHFGVVCAQTLEAVLGVTS